MEYMEKNLVDYEETAFMFYLKFNYHNEKSEKDMAEDTGRPVLWNAICRFIGKMNNGLLR